MREGGKKQVGVGSKRKNDREEGRGRRKKREDGKGR